MTASHEFVRYALDVCPTCHGTCEVHRARGRDACGECAKRAEEDYRILKMHEREVRAA